MKQFPKELDSFPRGECAPDQEFLREPVIEDETLSRKERAQRAFICFLGMAFLSSSVCIWMSPTADIFVAIVKLGASAVMMIAGILLIRSLNEDAIGHRTRFELDLAKRELRTFEIDPDGSAFLTGRHKIDNLSELTLQNACLLARDVSGQLVVSVPVRDQFEEDTLRRAFSFS